jgi:hypothetical protein
MARFPESNLLKKEFSALPAEALAFLRYLGFDPRKPNEIPNIIEVPEAERGNLYRVWHNFCGDT